ncbi:MAG: hypothetical protein ACOCP8_04885 [archaeon]
MRKVTTFEERLEDGNDKEDFVRDYLNLSGIPCKLNNEENPMDIDLYLPYDDLYIDVKHLQTHFDATHYLDFLTAENNLIVSVKHLKNYRKKQEKTGIESWIAFLVNYNINGKIIFELRYIKVDDIFKLEYQGKAVRRTITSPSGYKTRIINLNRLDCLDGFSFFNYIKCRRKNHVKCL